jgi:hypothetical protein
MDHRRRPPPHLGQHVADLVEQLVRLVEPAGGFGAAARLAVAVSPIRDARDHAGDVRDRCHSMHPIDREHAQNGD